MSTAVGGRAATNLDRDKGRDVRYPIIGRILESTATILMLLIAVELTLGFMACYYSCAARNAAAEDEKIDSVAEGLPNVPSIIDADQLVKIDHVVNNIPTKTPAYAYFSEESCSSKKNDQDPMHEKMPFGSNLMTPCEVLENVKSLSLGNAFAGGKKNVTIFEHFMDFLGRLREKYERQIGKESDEDCGLEDENPTVNLDHVQLVATS